MHIGVFSGTFDPVHDGHVLFAQTALEQFGLDKVIFLPEAHPRRKTDVTEFKDRKTLLAIALENYPQLELLDAVGHKTHDIGDTLPYLQNHFGNAEITLLMGADVFEHAPSWPDFDLLREESGVIVGLRTEDDGEVVMPLAAKLDMDVEFMQSPLSSVSSSKIRDALGQNQPPVGLDDEVHHYIVDKKLYTT